MRSFRVRSVVDGDSRSPIIYQNSIKDPLKVSDHKDYSFHISAKYDFDKRIWKSWWFEIERDFWKDSGLNDYKYPILNDHIFFYNNFNKITNFTERNEAIQI